MTYLGKAATDSAQTEEYMDQLYDMVYQQMMGMFGPSPAEEEVVEVVETPVVAPPVTEAPVTEAPVVAQPVVPQPEFPAQEGCPQVVMYTADGGALSAEYASPAILSEKGNRCCVWIASDGVLPSKSFPNTNTEEGFKLWNPDTRQILTVSWSDYSNCKGIFHKRPDGRCQLGKLVVADTKKTTQVVATDPSTNTKKKVEVIPNDDLTTTLVTTDPESGGVKTEILPPTENVAISTDPVTREVAVTVVEGESVAKPKPASSTPLMIGAAVGVGLLLLLANK